jgi:riboflavin synthase
MSGKATSGPERRNVFTGIVSALGDVRAAERREGLLRLTIGAPYAADGIEIGASIAHDGCCLTVVEKTPEPGGGRFVVEVAPESLALTTLGSLNTGDKVNLERSLRVGDELGGHMVQGHVDGLGEVLSVKQDGEGWRLRIKPPQSITHLIAAKGSIAVAGVSLTVNEVDAEGFGVLIIPHTWSVTTLSKLKAGDKVNLEADMMARYAARLIEARR